MIYQTEKTIKENEDKVSDAAKAPVKEALEVAKKALEGGQLEEMKSAGEALLQASFKMSEELYKQAAGDAGQPPPPGADGGQPGPDAAADGKGDDVVDAEFEEAN